MGDREKNIYFAKLAEQAERYEEMVANMKDIINMDLRADELDQEERNLISVGYKNMMSVRRTSWRTVQSYEDKEAKSADSDKDLIPLIVAYKDTIAAEIDGVIDKVMEDVVTKYTKGPSAAVEPENLVFFHKMEGDYYRYGAEISAGQKREEYKAKASAAYEKAKDACESGEGKGLEKTNPIWLGLALNFSVFYYEICEETEKAKELAKNAFDKALEELDALPEDQYKDSTLIMQLLKDNLTLWNETDDGELEVVDMDS